MSGDAKEFLDTLRLLLIEKVDPEAIDREGAIGEEVIEAFATGGLTRASLGVQVLDSSVQKRINRIQTEDQIAAIRDWLAQTA